MGLAGHRVTGRWNRPESCEGGCWASGTKWFISGVDPLTPGSPAASCHRGGVGKALNTADGRLARRLSKRSRTLFTLLFSDIITIFAQS